MQPPQLSVQLSPGLAHVRMPLRPKVRACASPIREFALEWQATPDVHAIARLPPRLLPAGGIEQEVVLEAAIDLPYPAQCASLVARVRSWSSNAQQEVVLDTPIASCTEGP